MKRYLYTLLLILALPLCASARGNGEAFKTLQPTDTVQLLKDQVADLSLGNRLLGDSITKLRAENQRLRDQLTVSAANSQGKADDLAALRHQCDSLRSIALHVGRVDTLLFNIASNFLYIPYDSYSIDKLAIPALDSIRSPELRNAPVYRKRMDQLRNYETEVKELGKFLYRIQKNAKSNLMVIDGSTYLSKLQNFPLYQRYLGKGQQYADTFFGTILTEVKKRLENFHDGKNRPDFKDILTRLRQCLPDLPKLEDQPTPEGQPTSPPTAPTN